MAAQIDITGTGRVILRYTFGGDTFSTKLDAGTSILIDEASTDVSYTTISGDAVASSIIFVITELPMTYYRISWEAFLNYGDNLGNVFDTLILGEEEYSLPDVPVTISPRAIVNSINGLQESSVGVTSFKTSATNTNTIDVIIILRIVSSDIPMLQIRSGSGLHRYLIEGVSVAEAVPEGYKAVYFCTGEDGDYSPITTTTTTTIAP